MVFYTGKISFQRGLHAAKHPSFLRLNLSPFLPSFFLFFLLFLPSFIPSLFHHFLPSVLDGSIDGWTNDEKA